MTLDVIVVNMKKEAYHHGDLKPELVKIARLEVINHGREALSLRTVSEKLGVSSAAIYRHFRSKDALLAAVAAEGFKALETALKTVFDLPATPLERFRKTGDVYAEFARQNPRLYGLMFASGMLSSGHAEVDCAATSAYGVLRETMRQCQRNGDLREGDITDHAFAIYAAAHGTIALCANGPPPFCPEATIERGLDLIWQTAMHGMAPR